MLKIRLTRRGKKNKAFFRLVVAEHTSPIKGRFLEALGFLNPHTKEKNLKADRIKYWIGKGAQCSDTAHNLLVKEGIIEGPKRAVKMKKKEESELVESAPSSAPADIKALADKEAVAGKEKAPVSSAETKEIKETAEKKEEVKTEKAEEAKPEAEPEKKTGKEAPVETKEEEK